MKVYEIHLMDGTSEFVEGHTADMYNGMITVYKSEWVDRKRVSQNIVYQRSLIGVVDITSTRTE